MTISYRSAISVVELIVYFPALFIAAYISFRHGFGRNAGWVFLILFSLARIIGSCCQIQVEHKPSKNLFIATAIISSVGLSPLLLTSVGLLSRVFDGLYAKSHVLATRLGLRPIQTVTLIGLIFCIIGGSNSASSSNITKVDRMTKAGIILYLIAFAAICLMTVYLATRRLQIENGEKRLVLAVAFSLPFLFVRLIYSSIASLGHSSRFNIVNGSVTVLLVMAVLEEFVIVVTYLVTGLSLQVIAKRESLPTVADQASRHDDGGVPSRSARSGFHRRGGLIGLLIRTIKGERRQNYHRADPHELSEPQKH